MSPDDGKSEVVHSVEVLLVKRFLEHGAYHYNYKVLALQIFELHGKKITNTLVQQFHKNNQLTVGGYLRTCMSFVR